MEFMTVEQIRAASPAIGEALRGLLESRSLAHKSNAGQWRFLSASLQCILGAPHPSEFDDLAPPHAAQLKFEVSDKLKRYYTRRQAAPRYIFQLVHRRELSSLDLSDPDDYPGLGGYVLLVRDGDIDLPPPRSRTERSDLRLYLERVVGGAVDAEFNAYLALPRMDLDVLKPWFDSEGPAFAEIADRVRQRARMGSVISNALNPSTKRLCSVQVRRVLPSEATVGTVEYWYLRWWDRREQEYVYAYREHQPPDLRHQGAGRGLEGLAEPSPRSPGRAAEPAGPGNRWPSVPRARAYVLADRSPRGYLQAPLMTTFVRVAPAEYRAVSTSRG